MHFIRELTARHSADEAQVPAMILTHGRCVDNAHAEARRTPQIQWLNLL
ncbi:hypothetical protein [Aureliella helgolandensis]|nr:hypothetical protein [Aureliella helgolandensis]